MSLAIEAMPPLSDFRTGKFVPPDYFLIPEGNPYRVLSNDDITFLNVMHETNLTYEKKFREGLKNAEPTAIQHENDVDIKTRNLQLGIDQARENLHRHNRQIELISSRYQKAQELMQQSGDEYTMSNWIRTLTKVFPGGVQFIFDMDLTLTQEVFLNHLPGSSLAEPYIKAYGREAFINMYVRFWEPALSNGRAASIFEKVGKRTNERPGVHNFFKYAEKKGIPVQIVSANFEPVVNGFASKLPYRNLVGVHSVKVGDVTVTDKSTRVVEIAASDADRAVLYGGDAASDEPAADQNARQVVGAYFPLKNASFEQILKNAQLPHEPFVDFFDILRTVQSALG